jgi:HSP20 family protein
METKIETKAKAIEEPADWSTIEAAGEDLLERFREDLREIGLDLELFENRMGSLAAFPLPRLAFPALKGTASPLDLEETATNYQVRVNMPGVPKELVGIKFHDQTLDVEAEMKEAKETEKRSYVLRERRATEYHRRVSFPTPVTPEKAEAKLEHGVLTVTVPKVKPAKELRVPVS